MRVFFVNHASPEDHLGGAELSLLKLVSDWESTDPDFEPTFITRSRKGPFARALEQRAWPTIVLPYEGWVVSGYRPHTSDVLRIARSDYESTVALIDTIEQLRPDLVVTNTIIAPLGAFAAAATSTPHAWFVREYGDLDHGLHFINGRENTLADIGTLSAVVFSNSVAMRTHLSAHIDPQKIQVVYPSVDADEVLSLTAEPVSLTPFPNASGALKIVTVGRLTRSKGQWRVVEALGELKRRGVEARACFVGARVEADHDAHLMRRARELGVGEWITFAGEQPNPFGIVAMADVAVTPSGLEAFGRTTLEYLILSKPVVATVGGGSAELVRPDINGYLFEPDDIEQLADHLERYARRPSLMAEHGEAGAARARIIADTATGNSAAIRRMIATAAEPAYRLPEIARLWFRLPSMYASTQAGAIASMTYTTRRVYVRGRNFARDPIGVLRRRWALARRQMTEATNRTRLRRGAR